MEGTNLFSLEMTKEYTFSFSSETQKYMASSACSTDYDLTGQILWPAAKLLSKYIIKNKEMIIGKTFIELGAGVGLCSLVASKYAAYGIATDYQPEVLSCIQNNMKLYGSSNVKCAMLDWNNSKYIELVEYNGKLIGEPLLQIDYVLGADIVYWEESIEPLIKTMNDIYMANSNHPVMLLAIKNRVKTVFNMLLSKLKSANFKISFENVEDLVEESDMYLMKITK